MSKPFQTNPTFQFVRAQPPSESEKVKNRAIVRGHASRYSWRKLKHPPASSDLGRAGKTRLQLAERSTCDLEPAVSAQSSEDSSDQPNDFEGTGIDNGIAHANVHTSSRQLSAVITKPRPCRSASWSIQSNVLRNDSVDPFETYPSELSSGVIGPILAQVTDFLSQALPHPGGSVQTAAADSWFQTCISQRGLFHAMIFGQLSRNKIRNPVSSSYSSLLLLSHSEAVREINKNMLHPSTACHDRNVLAVLVLAFNGSVLADKPGKVPYQGPLRTMQMLDVYGGALEPVSIHMDGLKQMLRIRGGINDIKQPGLAQLLSYGSIIEASRKLKTPLLPYVSMNPSIPDELMAVRRPMSAFPCLGKGFMVLQSILPPPFFTRLYPILLQLCDYTIAVHNYVEGTAQAQSVSVLADERNFVQHNLMSLESHGKELDLRQEHPLYELSRLAAIIYSLTVVFPLPSTTAPFEVLETRMKDLMSNEIVAARWNKAPHLMLWITFMAAIAAVTSTDRAWFVCILDRLISRVGIKSWLEMRESLRKYLWFDSTNDVDGVRLWEEIERSSPFTA